MSDVCDNSSPVLELIRDINRIAKDADTFGNVTLISVDDVHHRASSLILAVRCKFFEALYYGANEIVEDKHLYDAVRVSATSAVLLSALEFIYNGKATFLNHVNDIVFMKEQLDDMQGLSDGSDGKDIETKKGASKDEDASPVKVAMISEADVKHTISVAILAKEIGCLSLRKECVETLVSICRSFPQFSCTIFEAMYGENGVAVERVREEILMVFEDSPLESFLVWHGIKCHNLKECLVIMDSNRPLQLSEKQIKGYSERGLGVCTLSPSALKTLVQSLQGRGIQRSEYMFMVIMCWIEGRYLHSLNGCGEEPLQLVDVDNKDRMYAVSDTIAELDFLDMRKKFVAKLVENCGALERDQLFTVFRKMALSQLGEY